MKHVAGGLHHIFSEYNKIKQQELKIAHGQKTGKNKQTVSMHQFTATVSCRTCLYMRLSFRMPNWSFVCLQTDKQSMDNHLKMLNKKGQPALKGLPSDDNYKEYPDTIHIWVIHKAVEFKHGCKKDSKQTSIAYSMTNSYLPGHEGQEDMLWDVMSTTSMATNMSPQVCTCGNVRRRQCPRTQM